jgi:hypothetical protein
MKRTCICLLTIFLLGAVAAGQAQKPSKSKHPAAAKPESMAATAPAGDSSPSGMVAFFMTTLCPSGWTVPAAVQGRSVVGVIDPKTVGVVVGTPMANQNAPTHSHTFTGSMTMDSKEVSAAHCCNNSAAAAKTYSVPGTLNANTANLPFMQLVVCQKQ